MNDELKNLEDELSEDDYLGEGSGKQAFVLNQEDITLPTPIRAISVTEKCILLGLEGNQILRKRLEIDDIYKSIGIPYTIESPTTQIYSDLHGYHSIITLEAYEYLYLNLSEDNVVLLKSLSGMQITSIGFGASCSIMATNEMLLGSGEGGVYLYNLERNTKFGVLEASPKKVFQLSTNSLIRGLVFDSSVVIATDDSLYQFDGELPFTKLFEKYKDDSKCKKATIKGRLTKAELKVCYSYKDNIFKLNSFTWKTGGGIAHGNFNIIKNMQPYNKEIPEFIIVSEDYTFMAYPDIVRVVTKEMQEVVCSEELAYAESLRCGVYDACSKCFWVSSGRKLFRMYLQSKDSSRDFKLDYENYENILKHCKKKDKKEYKKLVGKYANGLMRKGKYAEAAVLYKESNIHFESIVLKFMKAEAYDQLKVYLTKLLESLEGIKKKKIQRVMLCTLLLELQLDKLNKLGAELDAELPENTTGNNQEISALYNKAVKEFNSFLEKYQADLDSHTTFQLLQNHKRVNDSLSFAILKKDYETVLLYYLNKHDYKAAIEMVNDIKNNKTKNTLMQRYAATFIKHETQLTIDSLSRYYPTIEPEDIIMSIINVSEEKRSTVNTYIKSIMDRVKSKLIYNLYVFFLAEDGTSKSLKELNEFLEQQETLRRSKQELNVDPGFALVTFKNFGLVEEQIKVYGLIGFYEEAVKLSIQHKKYSLAKEYASLPQDEKLKKELWLLIASVIIKENPGDVRIGLKVMKESKILAFVDILPLLSSKMMLSSFKDDLAISLQSYGERLRELKGQMNDYNKSAEEINTQLKELKNSCIPVPSDQHCDKCKKPLIGNTRFYVFPCLHCFHRDCIIDKMLEFKAYIPKKKITKLQNIVSFMQKIKEIRRRKDENEQVLDQGDFIGFLNTLGNLFMKTRPRLVEEQKRVEISVKDQERLKEYEQELERLLSEYCILCGSFFIETVDATFDSSKERTWKI